MPTEVERDAVTGTETTGHEWDGVKELNTPLPRWWLWTFYATILWAVGYWVVYPAWPTLTDYTKGLLGWSQYEELADQLRVGEAQKAAYLDRFRAASFEEIRADKDLLDFAIAGGRTPFADNCVPCHGQGGAGAKGYPNLADDDWLWGGDMDAIWTTMLYGIRSNHEETRVSDMPRFGIDELLTEAQVSDVAEYVLSLSGKAADDVAAERGAALYDENCSICHGVEGEGSRDFGAPRLNDAIWLFGGEKEAVVETVTKARGGVMPAWVNRLDETTIKMLTVFVHSLGGGQ
jgi:cytochrome c oxidase cbb3-type subunit 3